MSHDAVFQLEAKIQTLPQSLQEEVQRLFEDSEFVREDEGDRAWYWAGFKRYSSDPDIAFLESHLSDLEWEQYLYIRVGEDLDDAEYQGGFWDNPFGMCLTRGIGFDEE
jgi:hypothetical protein